MLSLIVEILSFINGFLGSKKDNPPPYEDVMRDIRVSNSQNRSSRISTSNESHQIFQDDSLDPDIPFMRFYDVFKFILCFLRNLLSSSLLETYYLINNDSEFKIHSFNSIELVIQLFGFGEGTNKGFTSILFSMMFLMLFLFRIICVWVIILWEQNEESDMTLCINICIYLSLFERYHFRNVVARNIKDELRRRAILRSYHR